MNKPSQSHERFFCHGLENKICVSNLGYLSLSFSHFRVGLMGFISLFWILAIKLSRFSWEPWCYDSVWYCMSLSRPRESQHFQWKLMKVVLSMYIFSRWIRDANSGSFNEIPRIWGCLGSPNTWNTDDDYVASSINGLLTRYEHGSLRPHL